MDIFDKKDVVTEVTELQVINDFIVKEQIITLFYFKSSLELFDKVVESLKDNFENKIKNNDYQQKVFLVF